MACWQQMELSALAGMGQRAERAPFATGRSASHRSRFLIRGLTPDVAHRGCKPRPTAAAGSVASRGEGRQRERARTARASPGPRDAESGDPMKPDNRRAATPDRLRAPGSSRQVGLTSMEKRVSIPDVVEVPDIRILTLTVSQSDSYTHARRER